MRFILTTILALSLNASALGDETPPQTAKAIFAGGCFWCMEPPFDEVEGVVATTSGYTGGQVPNPSYEQVTRGGTGHYEAVKVTYHPAQVSYRELLDIFWRNIDPLDAGGQFCDRGSSYRSAIFYLNDKQRRAAIKSKEAVSERFSQWAQSTESPQSAQSTESDEPVATELIAATEFYPAEDYHQDYYQKNPLRYKYYRYRCGRDQRLEQLWQ